MYSIQEVLSVTLLGSLPIFPLGENQKSGELRLHYFTNM